MPESMLEHPTNVNAQVLLTKLWTDAIMHGMAPNTYGMFGVTFTVQNGIFVEATPVKQPVLRLPKVTQQA